MGMRAAPASCGSTEVMRYDARLDRMIDLRQGLASNGMHDAVMDEIELGARVSLAIDDPEQYFWALHFNDRELQESPVQIAPRGV